MPRGLHLWKQSWREILYHYSNYHHQRNKDFSLLDSSSHIPCLTLLCAFWIGSRCWWCRQLDWILRCNCRVIDQPRSNDTFGGKLVVCPFSLLIFRRCHRKNVIGVERPRSPSNETNEDIGIRLNSRILFAEVFQALADCQWLSPLMQACPGKLTEGSLPAPVSPMMAWRPCARSQVANSINPAVVFTAQVECVPELSESRYWWTSYTRPVVVLSKFVTVLSKAALFVVMKVTAQLKLSPGRRIICVVAPACRIAVTAAWTVSTHFVRSRSWGSFIRPKTTFDSPLYFVASDVQRAANWSFVGAPGLCPMTRSFHRP